MSMTTYKCPHCGNQIGAIGTPTAPVTCSGMKRTIDEDTGRERFRPTHPSTVCVIIDGGVTKPQPTTQKAKATKMAKEPTNLCGCYSVVDSKGVHTSCGRLVKGKFAPGHDAKLKGMLIRAAVAGEKFVTKDGTKTTTNDPMAFATELGWGKLIQKGIDTAAAKAAKPKRTPRDPNAPKVSTNRVAIPAKVSRDELKARAAAKAAQKAEAKPTGRKSVNAKKAALQEASLV